MFPWRCSALEETVIAIEATRLEIMEGLVVPGNGSGGLC